MYRLCLLSLLVSLAIGDTTSIDDGKHGSEKDFKQAMLSTKLISVLVTICLQTAQQICLSPHAKQFHQFSNTALERLRMVTEQHMKIVAATHLEPMPPAVVLSGNSTEDC